METKEVLSLRISWANNSAAQNVSVQLPGFNCPMNTSHQSIRVVYCVSGGRGHGYTLVLDEVLVIMQGQAGAHTVLKCNWTVFGGISNQNTLWLILKATKYYENQFYQSYIIWLTWFTCFTDMLDYLYPLTKNLLNRTKHHHLQFIDLPDLLDFLD